MSTELIKLHGMIVQLKLNGNWGLAQALEQILIDELKKEARK